MFVLISSLGTVPLCEIDERGEKFTRDKNKEELRGMRS